MKCIINNNILFYIYATNIYFINIIILLLYFLFICFLYYYYYYYIFFFFFKKKKETGHLSAMKNELLIAAKNKISFDPSKKVRKWVRQPIVFGTLGSTFNGSMWHSSKKLYLFLYKFIY